MTANHSLLARTRWPRTFALPLGITLLLAAPLVTPAIAASKSLPAPPPTASRGTLAPVKTEATRTTPVFDYSGIGGSVYSTGLGPVIVTTYPVSDFLSDGFYAYPTTVHLLRDDKETLIGSNRERRTLKLGVLPRGEIRLVGRCSAGDPVFESGPGSRNPDGAPHSRVKEVSPGVVEVYFESTMVEGKRNDRTEQHWYKDVKLVFTGAVTADPGVNRTLDLVNDPDPATRSAARTALKTLNPKLAAQAGVR